MLKNFIFTIGLFQIINEIPNRITLKYLLFRKHIFIMYTYIKQNKHVCDTIVIYCCKPYSRGTH
jgi:hypothetical protein